MKVFITGATGYIGAAVSRRLLKAGHEVSGLARDPAKAAQVPGLRTVAGDMKDPAGWKAAASAADALIHLASEMGPGAPKADAAALDGLLAAARSGGRKLLVYTSGVWVLGPKKAVPADEQTPLDPLPIVGWRPAHEKRALEAAGGDVSVAVVRPGCVYGGKGGIYGMMLSKDAVTYVGDGANCWATVHLEDLADLYALLLERRPDRATYHATDGSAEPLKQVAEALAAAAGKPAAAWPLPEARTALGPFADALAVDQRVSSEKARRELGWKPAFDSVAKHAAAVVRDQKS